MNEAIRHRLNLMPFDDFGRWSSERRTHSYVRHGTTSLFAALDVASGFVIGKCYKRHRAAEFLDFLKRVDAQVPRDLDVHTIMDNYATHKTAAIRAWLARRPRYHVHFSLVEERCQGAPHSN